MRNLLASSGVSLIVLIALLGFAQAQVPLLPAPGVEPPDPDPQRQSLQSQIVAQERAGLNALKAGDLTAFAASTAEDAVFVDAHGSSSKAEVMKHTADFRLHGYSMDDVRYVAISEDSGLIVYTLTESGNNRGKEFVARVHVSSLWRKRDGKWMCAFSQETAAK
jgi:ketosteroid isomerase-like protein